MNRQRLVDVLTAPVQHLTRYPLMLRSVVHTAYSKDDKLQIQMMLDKADEANLTLNHLLSNNDIHIQLIEIMKTIESYDAVDQDEYSKLVPPYCPPFLNLIQPMKYALSPAHTLRRIFTRGDLKLKENRTAPKVEVHCILFTDLLLICKFTSRRADRFRIHKSPLVLCRTKTIPFTEGSKSFCWVIRILINYFRWLLYCLV
jgi:pleckstrin domain-containing family G protein 5